MGKTQSKHIGETNSLKELVDNANDTVFFEKSLDKALKYYKSQKNVVDVAQYMKGFDDLLDGKSEQLSNYRKQIYKIVAQLNGGNHDENEYKIIVKILYLISCYSLHTRLGKCVMLDGVNDYDVITNGIVTIKYLYEGVVYVLTIMDGDN